MNGLLRCRTVRMKERERPRRVEKQTVSVFQTLKQRNVDSDPDNGPPGLLAVVDSSLMNAIRTISVLSSRLSELFGVSPFVGSTTQACQTGSTSNWSQSKLSGSRKMRCRCLPERESGFQSKLPLSNGWTRRLTCGAPDLTPPNIGAKATAQNRDGQAATRRNRATQKHRGPHIQKDIYSGANPRKDRDGGPEGALRCDRARS